MADRVTYRGSKLFLNGIGIRRIQSFGSSTQLNREELFEIGNAGIAKVIQDTSDVEGTIESTECGSSLLLSVLANKRPLDTTPGITTNSVLFSKDFENAKFDVYALLKPDNSAYLTQYIKDCYATSANYSFTTDGNFTERYNFSSEFKQWLIGTQTGTSTVVSNNKVWIIREKLGATPVSPYVTTIALTANTTNVTVLGTYKMDKATKKITKLANATYDSVTTKKFTVVGGTWATDDEVIIVFSADNTDTSGASNMVEPDLDSQSFTGTATGKYNPAYGEYAGALRKGYAKVYLVPDSTGWDDVNGGYGGNEATVAGALVPLSGIQSVGLDVSLDREELLDVSSSTAIAKPLVTPLSVSVSLEWTQRDFDILKKFATDTDVTKTITPGGFKDATVGLRIILYKDKDSTATPLKQFDIPKLTVDSESWNLATQGNASQSLSAKAHELLVTFSNKQ